RSLPTSCSFYLAACRPVHHSFPTRRSSDLFAGKEVMIGEVGWPSAGRMREGALPSPANQARFLQEVTATARSQNYRVNVIEAFRSEEHTSELQSRENLVCRLLLEKKKKRQD